MNRIPPQSLGSEQAILGAILLDNLVLDHYSFPPEEFYRASHQQIYAAMLDLKQEHQTIDLVTLVEKLKSRRQIEGVGGAVYLAELNDCVPTAAGVAAHISIVREKARLRQLIGVLGDAAIEAYKEEQSADVLIKNLDLGLFRIAYGDGKTTGLKPFDDYEEEGARIRIPTGVSLIDSKTEGGMPGVTILGGEPKVNKTTAAWEWGLNWAEKGGPVNMWDAEMGKIAMRERIKRKIPRCFWYNSNPSSMTFGALQEDVKRRGTTDKPLLHIIDNLQALLTDFDERRNEIDRWINWIVKLKRTNPVVFLVVSEMSREGKFKESGSIEYRADLALRLTGMGDRRILKVAFNRGRPRKGTELCHFQVVDKEGLKLEVVDK